MNIAIDISPLQTAHRLRGIGFAIVNFINNISPADRKKHHFILFALPPGHETLFSDPLELIHTSGMDYEIRYLDVKSNSSADMDSSSSMWAGRWHHSFTRHRQTFQRRFPLRIQRLLTSISNQSLQIKKLYLGSHIGNLQDVDVFIQTDQFKSLPASRHIKKILIIYDIIPYILEWEYLWSYKTARLRGFSRKSGLRCQVRRWLYQKKLKINTRRANYLLAISNTTKLDFNRFLGTKLDKIRVVHLGVNLPIDGPNIKDLKLLRYRPTSWGYLPHPYKFDQDIPFILFVGGADARRRLQDLVTAFNNIRASGHNLRLVLTGDSMQGPNNISTDEIREALNHSSYLEDIIFLGFVDNDTREWLYEHTMAFVYPSLYEGFGLPVLEAMAHGCPVICYPNEAVKEVAGDLPIYAHGHEDLRKEIIQLMNLKAEERQAIGKRNFILTQKYSWAKTSRKIIESLEA